MTIFVPLAKAGIFTHTSDAPPVFHVSISCGRTVPPASENQMSEPCSESAQSAYLKPYLFSDSLINA